MKTNIRLKAKGASHYDTLIGEVDWSADSHQITEKNRLDKYQHIKRWETLLQGDTP